MKCSYAEFKRLHYEEKGSVSRPIMLLDLAKGSTYSSFTHSGEIIFIQKGCIRLKSDVYPVVVIEDHHFFSLPCFCEYEIEATTGTELIIIEIDIREKQPLYEKLRKIKLTYEDITKPAPLYAVHILQFYFTSIYLCLINGLDPTNFYQSKKEELFILLQKHYKKDLLSRFFVLSLSDDILFTLFIIKNRSYVKNAKELASLAQYSESGFNKKFKKVFGSTPHKWLNEIRSTHILTDIIHTDKPLKMIAQEHGFNSQQQLNDYCIRNYRSTPGSLRSF